VLTSDVEYFDILLENQREDLLCHSGENEWLGEGVDEKLFCISLKG